MAGEWIAYDLALPAKPEVQELIDVTGQPVEVVVYRLLQLWGWASMHCADGTARMTLARLARTCGGDEPFWRAVAEVGWLEIDEQAATVAVPGWDRRFSKSAKARLQHRDRAAAQESERGRLRSSAGTACAEAQGLPALKRRRGEERREEIPPPPRDASLENGEGWATLVAAWNAKPLDRRTAWTPVQPPSEAQDRLSEPGWLQTALEAIGRLRGCKYFREPVPLTQFCLPGFAQRVLEGRYDQLNPPKGDRRQADDRPPPKIDAALEASIAATLARGEAKRAAMHARLDAEATAAT